MLKDVKEEKVKELYCPKCGGTQLDWHDCSFREWLAMDYALFDAKMFCADCGHEWDATLDFGLMVMSYYTDEKEEHKVEQELK